MDEKKDIWAERLKDREYTDMTPDPFIRDWINRLAKKGARALDMGCGWGRHMRLLCIGGFEAIGLDSSIGMLAKAKANLDRAGYEFGLIEGDAAEIPFPAECFDLVICTRTIHHGDRRFMVKCLTEIDRVLKVGGHLLGSFPSVNDWRFGTGIAIEPGTFVPDINEEEGGIPHHFCNADELLLWLKNYKFEGWEEILEPYKKEPTEEQVEGVIESILSPLGYGSTAKEYRNERLNWATYFLAARKISPDDPSL